MRIPGEDDPGPAKDVMPSVPLDADGHGQRPVRYIFAGEGVLVHLRAHVAGIDAYNADFFPAQFVSQGEREQVERGFGGAVSAPTFVAARSGVAADVDHQTVGGGELLAQR